MVRRVLTVVSLSILLVASTAVAALLTQSDDEKALVGVWEMTTEFQGQEMPATMTLSISDGKLVGVWKSMGQEMDMTAIEVDGQQISFKRPMGRGGDELSFEGTVDGNEIDGKYISPMGGEYKCTGKRKSDG